MVFAPAPTCDSCLGEYALSNPHGDGYAHSLTYVDGNAFPNQHSSRHGCADGDRDPNPDRDFFSHSDTAIDSHAPSDSPLAVANP